MGPDRLAVARQLHGPREVGLPGPLAQLGLVPLVAGVDRAGELDGDVVTLAAQRGDRLDALQDKTDNLATSAQGFRRGANRVRKQMWWKDMKMRICIIVGIIILLIVIIVPSGKDFPLSTSCARPGRVEELHG